MGKKTAASEGRSAGARLHAVPGLEEVEMAADSVGTRRQRARCHASGAQGGNRDGTAAGVGGVTSQLARRVEYRLGDVGLFDRETWLFINSFAPWLAALGTVLAVIVSLRLARRISRPDIRVFISLISLFGQEIPKKVFVQINAVNHSRKAVVNTIAWWSWRPLGFGRRKQGWIVLPQHDPHSTTLPCELDFGKEASFFFPIDTFHESWEVVTRTRR